MDTDKIKIFGARVKVDGTGKLAELERAERVSNTLRTVMTKLIYPGEDEGKGSRYRSSRSHLFRQPSIDLQLPREPARRVRNHVD